MHIKEHLENPEKQKEEKKITLSHINQEKSLLAFQCFPL